MPRRPSVKLTKRLVDGLAHRAERYFQFDTAVRGFAVRVSAAPKTTKTYVFWYRVGRRQRMAKIGGADTLTVDQARKRATAFKGSVSSGEDPQAEKDATKAALPVRQLITEWLEKHITPRRKPATVRSYTLAVEQHLVPAFGSRPVGQLTDGDVVTLHTRLSGTPTLANRVIAALSSFCTWCEKRGYRPRRSNPCFGLERYGEREHKRYLDVSEYQTIGQALRDAEQDQTISTISLTAIRLLMLTGCRPAEIATLKWAHVDLKGAALRLPDSKTGEKIVHLGAAARQILKRWPRFADSAYVFPGNGRRVKGAHIHPTTLSHAWQDLRKAAGLAPARLYDAARHSYASVGISKHGLSLPEVGGQLGHTQPRTTARYAHLHDTTARQNANAVGGTIAAALKRKRSA